MRFIMFVVALCIVNTNAFGVVVDSVIGLYPESLYEDLFVTDAGIFSPDGIDVHIGISIVNRGIINSDFYIDEARHVFVTNSGTINGEFYVAPDASVIQIVQSEADINSLTVNGNFSVCVCDATDISLNRVLDIATDADKLILDNSTLVLNSARRNIASINGPGAVDIVGDVVIKLNYADYSAPVLRNVSNIGRVRFDMPGMNPLYNIDGYVDDGDLYVRLVRETDYARIFQNELGNFLYDLRRSMPDDKLLLAMDNAPDMDAINSIMRDSVRLQPINLMAPIRRMHALDALSGWRYSDTSDIAGATDVMFSDTSLLGRTNISWVGNVINNLRVAVDGYVGALVVADDINDFSGGLCGANMRLHFDDGTIIGNLTGGIGIVYFDVGPVFDGNATVNNPSGISGVVSMDVGTYLYRESDLTIVPFAGVLTDYVSVLNDNDTTALANVGLELNLSEHDFDILYDYGFRGGVLTDGAYHFGVYAKFMVPDDDIGGQVNASLIHDEFGFGYKISVSANMAF